MSRSEFDPATDSETDDEEEEAAQHSAESGDDDEIQNEEEMTGGKKKRAKLAPKDFVEVERWDRMEMSDSDILAHIRRHLFQFNKDAGIIHVPDAHRDRNDKYGDWVYRHPWTTKKGVVSNTILDCPYRMRCGCLCQSKIVEMPTKTILVVADLHTTDSEDHGASKDKAKFLKLQDKVFIREAVRICPNQTAKVLMRNVASSPTKAISIKQKKWVERMVRAERQRLVSFQRAFEEPGRRCAFEEPGRRLQERLVNWLCNMRESHAAEWFEKHWCCEVTARKNATFCGKNQFQLHFYAVQVALPYYISEMVKSMRQDSIALEAELEMRDIPTYSSLHP